MKDFMILGESITLVKMRSPFGPYYKVYRGEELLGAILRINDPSFGKVWESLLLGPNNRAFKMPTSERAWRAAVGQLLNVDEALFRFTATIW